MPKRTHTKVVCRALKISMEMKRVNNDNEQIKNEQNIYYINNNKNVSSIRFGKYLEIYFVYCTVFFLPRTMRNASSIKIYIRLLSCLLLGVRISITRYWFPLFFSRGGWCGAKTNKSIWNRNRSIWSMNTCVPSSVA